MNYDIAIYHFWCDVLGNLRWRLKHVDMVLPTTFTNLKF